jgi:hypothetical protein
VVARRSSDPSRERDPVEGGGIPAEVADLTTDAATLFAEHLWHPIRKRRFVQRRLDENRKAVEALRAEEPDDPFDRTDWSPPRF